ncbi:MAG: hypothetical protein U5L72_17750 [Bacteroidales bacterium]|nr:hypothetical protein [Bacteroidales bacterium]
MKEGTYDYRDFSDDRVYSSFSLTPGETKKFFIILDSVIPWHLLYACHSMRGDV